MKEVLNLVQDNHLFAEHTVKDVFWGYRDPLLVKLNALLKKSNKPIVDKIGLFYGVRTTEFLFSILILDRNICLYTHFYNSDGAGSEL